ncbi:toprim domain-containing protein [Xenorhabdus sp. VLS]|uniref:Toprim domain-containing protein n=1 Tax=Xenorhabdus lircayensis TaxID=2763499 RepID=A0ABS0U8D5_9GAMM|nr:toprim domain-containing protein [Xenorhabdus lircayensis]
MKTAKAVNGHWPEIFAYYKLPPVTGKHHFKGKCPICGRRGKFRIDNKDNDGSWICVCGAGDGWALLRLTQNKDFKTLADEIDAFLGIQSDKRSVVKKETNITAFRNKVTACYPNLLSLKGTPGESYLRNRGIHVLPADNVRYCPDQPTHQGHLQAIWALATDSKGQLCYLHRTYLDGDKKANITPQKKMNSLQEDSYLEHTQSVAIRLFPVDSTLGIAEGIETALSCKQVYGVNTWSAMNAGHMAKFIAPMGVKHLIVFADNDWSATGHAAAHECARKNLVANNDIEKVSVRWPDIGDFNDLLQNGDEARELVFMKKQREKNNA